MAAFEGYIYEGIAQSLRDLPRELAADTYVISVFIRTEQDDARRPYLLVGVNTEQQVAASDVGEADARWNPSYWLQDPQRVLAESARDHDGARLRRPWLERLGLWFGDDEQGGAHPGWFDNRTGQIGSEFRELVIRVIRRLHADGVIAEVFGQPLPVIVREYEQFEGIAVQSERANPAGVVDEFAAWVRERASSAV
ncbi:MAG: hypothetical protein QOJ29_3055 [Thermoleophilaceae bacterium]|nr:hypothetical protein [Thermoleophilaceae bacterium]